LPRNLGCCPSDSPQLNRANRVDNRRYRHDRSQNQRDICIHEPPFLVKVGGGIIPEAA
jgi:hypothetical protein